jgi:predicted ATPase
LIVPAGTTASPLFGREPEQRALIDALTTTLQGTGGCDVVTGPPGIGKSRLVQFAAEQARELGLAVASGPAIELNRIAPLTAVHAVLETAGPDGIDLTSLKDLDRAGLWYIDRLSDALESYAAGRPLLIAIDDAQWVDELSALALRMLVPALASSPVRWLLARRTVPTRTPAQDAMDFLVAEGARELRLGPLDGASVEQLCSHVLKANADDTVLSQATRANGNPFLVEQLLVAMNQAGQILTTDGTATVVGAELPASFVSAVDQRLRGLSPSARTLLDCGSVFGRPFTVHAAAELAGLRALVRRLSKHPPTE